MAAVKRQHDLNNGEPSKRVRKDPPTEPSRGLFFANLGPNVAYYDVCKIANQYGALESVKINFQKKFAFVNFVNEEAAKKLHEANAADPLKIGTSVLKVGWARAEPLDQETLDAVANGATRNLFIPQASGLPEEALAHTFQRFGEIENIVHIQAKNIVFVNLTSLKGAIAAHRAAEGQTLDCAGRKIRVSFAKEVGVNSRDPRSRAPAYAQPPAAFPTSMPAPVGNHSRSIYVGALPEDVTLSDICKLANRYGAIDQITFNQEKKTAFINFVDNNAAAALFAASQQSPILVHNKPVRANWAKSTPLRMDLQDQIRRGATRNLYLGGVPETLDDAQIRETFSKYGEIDNVVVLRNKNVAFVNFAAIRSAINAKNEQIANPTLFGADGSQVKINFAKETIGRGLPPVHHHQAPAPYEAPAQYPPQSWQAPQSNQWGPSYGSAY